MHFVALDVETANQRISSICQIGIAGYASGSLVSEWETLVNPQADFDPLNTHIHGITADMTAEAPALPDIYDEIATRLRGKTVVSHTDFDRISLRRALRLYGLPPIECTWLDSATIARRAWKQFARKGYALKNVCDFLGYAFEHHNALADAKAAGFLVLEACRHTGLSMEDLCSRAALRRKVS